MPVVIAVLFYAIGVLVWSLMCGDASEGLGLNHKVIHDGRIYNTDGYSINENGTLTMTTWYTCEKCQCDRVEGKVTMPLGTYIIEERY